MITVTVIVNGEVEIRDFADNLQAMQYTLAITQNHGGTILSINDNTNKEN